MGFGQENSAEKEKKNGLCGRQADWRRGHVMQTIDNEHPTTPVGTTIKGMKKCSRWFGKVKKVGNVE